MFHGPGIVNKLAIRSSAYSSGSMQSVRNPQSVVHRPEADDDLRFHSPRSHPVGLTSFWSLSTMTVGKGADERAGGTNQG
eukprot:10377606-Alexandrium_andersonii.AAC.1